MIHVTELKFFKGTKEDDGLTVACYAAYTTVSSPPTLTLTTDATLFVEGMDCSISAAGLMTYNHRAIRKS